MEAGAREVEEAFFMWREVKRTEGYPYVAVFSPTWPCQDPPTLTRYILSPFPSEVLQSQSLNLKSNFPYTRELLGHWNPDQSLNFIVGSLERTVRHSNSSNQRFEQPPVLFVRDSNRDKKSLFLSIPGWSSRFQASANFWISKSSVEGPWPSGFSRCCDAC